LSPVISESSERARLRQPPLPGLLGVADGDDDVDDGVGHAGDRLRHPLVDDAGRVAPVGEGDDQLAASRLEGRIIVAAMPS
jgi:hypothetical protein